MRIVILALCGLVACGVFATMFLSLWSTRRPSAEGQRLHQSLASELVWLAIPCLMILAASIPAVIAIFATQEGR